MENEHPADWDPSSDASRQNQEAVYDEMRARCPVAHSKQWGWSIFKHADVMRVLLDHETFSNVVSQHLSVPNGMDPPEHTSYRKIIEKYFTPERMERFEPVCRKIARELVSDLPRRGQVEFMNEVALPFATAVQCAFLGWGDDLRPRLADWIRRNHAATLAQDRAELSKIAAEFQVIIDELLEARRSSKVEDATSELMHETVSGRPLSNEEVASILRNWTAGEIGTISAAVGIIARFLAEDAGLQAKLRSDRQLVSYAVNEILRVHGPLATNRRVTTCPVEIGGKKLGAGERISINWISANRDDEVFQEAQTFQFNRDQSKNLLYGAGIHVCPGAPLAELEMRVFTEEMLNATKEIGMTTKMQATYAQYPATGFATLPLRFR